jgi:alpha,alpha-trehalase
MTAVDFVPYPPIGRIGVVGDRRTAAAVAADGTVGWLCLPDFDGDPVLGALLDARRGGFFRLGPAALLLGRQRYQEETCVLLTRWETADGVLELTDAMAWPADRRAPADAGRRVLLRRLRCEGGEVRCRLALRARPDFGSTAATAKPTRVGDLGWRLDAGGHDLGLWCSAPLHAQGDVLRAAFLLRSGEEAWAVLGPGEDPSAWNAAAAKAALDACHADWRHWAAVLTYGGPRGPGVRRAARLMRLMSHAPSGALVAAPTAALPERVGGDRNYDYRYGWVRDNSLALAALATVGDLGLAGRYMDWLAGLSSATDQPLQVCYRADGGTELPERKRGDLVGWRGSGPVVFGNRAARQRQIDGLGYLADCALVYLERGGAWKPAYGRLVRRIADFAAARWREPGHGIWELDALEHWVSDKVMAWVALERAERIAARTGADADAVPAWRAAMDGIRAEVLADGWSEPRGAFRQRYGADALDASALLMATMDFLPPDDPQLRATVARIEDELTIDGLVHRFRPEELPEAVRSDLPMGAFEGAFLPCCFWLAVAQAREGRADAAEATIARAEAAAGELGLFAEEIDARGDGSFLGNVPLLFSHAEYLRAVLEAARSSALGRVEAAVGTAARAVARRLGGA